MLGLGEDKEDIRSLLRDLRASDVDVVTFGQYLRPSKKHISVTRYVPPEEFTEWQVMYVYVHTYVYVYTCMYMLIFLYTVCIYI
jgi:lipoate synthase